MIVDAAPEKTDGVSVVFSRQFFQMSHQDGLGQGGREVEGPIEVKLAGYVAEKLLHRIGPDYLQHLPALLRGIRQVLVIHACYASSANRRYSSASIKPERSASSAISITASQPSP